jgi:hypothetical protein
VSRQGKEPAVSPRGVMPPSGASGSRRKAGVKGLRVGSFAVLDDLFHVLVVPGWPNRVDDAVARGEDTLWDSRAARAAAAAAALRRRFLESESSCKDADVLDACAVQRAQVLRGGSSATLQPRMAALSAGVAMYAAIDGLTGGEAAAAFRAGLLVRSMHGDAGDFLAGSSEALANAVNGACSVDAHAESALAMMLVGANLPPGRNVYFHCAADDTIVQLSDAFRWDE